MRGLAERQHLGRPGILDLLLRPTAGDVAAALRNGLHHGLHRGRHRLTERIQLRRQAAAAIGRGCAQQRLGGVGRGGDLAEARGRSAPFWSARPPWCRASPCVPTKSRSHLKWSLTRCAGSTTGVPGREHAAQHRGDPAIPAAEIFAAGLPLRPPARRDVADGGRQSAALGRLDQLRFRIERGGRCCGTASWGPTGCSAHPAPRSCSLNGLICTSAIMLSHLRTIVVEVEAQHVLAKLGDLRGVVLDPVLPAEHPAILGDILRHLRQELGEGVVIAVDRSTCPSTPVSSDLPERKQQHRSTPRRRNGRNSATGGRACASSLLDTMRA